MFLYFSSLICNGHLLKLSWQFHFYDTWQVNAANDGGIAKAITQDEIDIFFGVIGLSVETSAFYTPIVQMTTFELVLFFNFFSILVNLLTRILVFYFFSFRSFFFFRTTTELNIWRDELLQPFDVDVWLSLVFLIILISVLIRVAFVFHKKKLERQGIGTSSFLITFGAFCQQGRS